jgi:hypothetical protein
MRVDEANDAAALEVFKAAQRRGQPITIGLTRQVLADLGSNANATAAYCQVRQWLRACESTARLARR